MKISKKTAVTKEITRAEQNRRNNLRRISVSAVVAFILFIALTVIQSSILNQEKKDNVYQVIANIESGTKITEENFDYFFRLKNVQISLIPEGYITSKEQVVNKFINRKYKVNDIVTSDGITDTEGLYKENIKNPVEVSFDVSGLSTAVAGTIREGDYINIYGLTRKSNEGDTWTSSSTANLIVDKSYVFNHVYVEKAFNGSGNRVQSNEISDKNTVTMIVLILSEDDVEHFTEMISNCSIRIAKLMYDTDKNYVDYINTTNKKAGKSEIKEN